MWLHSAATHCSALQKIGVEGELSIQHQRRGEVRSDKWAALGAAVTLVCVKV